MTPPPAEVEAGPADAHLHTGMNRALCGDDALWGTRARHTHTHVIRASRNCGDKVEKGVHMGPFSNMLRLAAY